MLNNEEYLDVLIVAPLAEEAMVLAECCDHIDLKCDKEEYDALLIEPNCVRFQVEHNGYKSLNCGLTCIGGMTNNISSIAMSKLLARYCPKCVLMVGLAGAGEKSKFKYGDVAIASEIIFSSYAKLTDSKLKDILLKKILKKGATEEENDKKKNSILQIMEHFSKSDEALLNRLSESVSEKEKDSQKALIKEVLECISADDFMIQELEPRIHGIPEVIDKNLLNIMKKHMTSAEWKKKAVEWFDDIKPVHMECFKKIYPNEKEFKSEIFKNEGERPKAHKAFVASGDFLVASSTFQKGIQEIAVIEVKAKKLKSIPEVFEMESYGALSICKSEGVVFGMVKGISDLANTDKTECYRLCAVAGASAFVATLIKRKDFAEALIDLKHPVHLNNHRCLYFEKLEEVGRCPFSHESLDKAKAITRERECTRIHPISLSSGNKIVSNTIGTVRTFNKVKNMEYSNVLKSLQKEMHTQTVFVFPYTAEQLFVFCKNHADISFWREIDEYIKGNSTISEDKVSHHIVKLGKVIRNKYEHFKIFDKECESKVIKSEFNKKCLEIASSICRIIPENALNNKVIAPRTELLSLLYPAILGFFVPTFIYTTESPFGYSDMTYLVKKHDGSDYVESALLHRPEMELLFVIGRCEKLENIGGEVFGLLTKLREVLGQVNDENPTIEYPFQISPFLSYFNGSLSWETMYKKFGYGIDVNIAREYFKSP